MKRASFFLPDDLRDRLAAESNRSGVPVAELVRRYLDAMTPPITIGFGELRRYVDRQGFLKVLVLSAREGKFLVEPADNEWRVQIWVDADLVRFEDHPVVPQQLAQESMEQSLRLNMGAPETEEPTGEKQ